jgi:uncharacterized membrane protein YeaQ/YmgE (transglycosylase-associated protein family)
VGIISWAIWGLVVGAVARILLPGRTHLGLALTILFGVAGSLVGGFFATEVLGIGDSNDFGFSSFLIAVGGSVVLIGVFERLNRALPDKRRAA